MLYDFRKSSLDNVVDLLNNVNPIGLTNKDIRITNVRPSSSNTSAVSLIDEVVMVATKESTILIEDFQTATVKIQRLNAERAYRQAGISSLRANDIKDYQNTKALLDDISATTGVIFDQHGLVSVSKYTDYLHVTIDYGTTINPALYGKAYIVVIQKDDMRDSLPFVYSADNVDGTKGFQGAVVINAARAGKSSAEILKETGIGETP